MDLVKSLLADLAEYGQRHREIGPLIERVRLVEDLSPGCTMWMSPKAQMGYNPTWVKQLSNLERKAVVTHELRHYENGHFLRYRRLVQVHGHTSMAMANVAMDMEINSPGARDNIPNLPIDGCFPAKAGFKEGLTFEEYLELLQRLPRIEVLLSPGGALHTPMSGDMRFPVDPSEILCDELIQEEILDEIEKASVGNTHGGQKGKTKIRKAPPIDIHQYIKALMARLQGQPSQGFDFVNFNKFHRKSLPEIIRFKSQEYKPDVNIAFVVDTSGSRTNTQINLSLSRIFHTLENADCEILSDLFFVDCEVAKKVRLTSKRAIPEEFNGRGGTRLDIVFEELDKQKIRYDLVIFLTDAYLMPDDLQSIPAKYAKKTVMGVDRENFEHTQDEFKHIPVFCH